MSDVDGSVALKAGTFNKIALIGIGLLGSSLALAIRRKNLAKTLTGADINPAYRERVEDLGLLDEVYEDASDAVKNADLVIFCVPVGAMSAVLLSCKDNLRHGAILTDVGSVKLSVLESLQDDIPDHVHFIPSHPIAGTEESGPEAGFSSLFDGRWCIITPPEGTSEEHLANLKAFWELCGSLVETMDARHHDLVLAITSHLPHLIAYNIVGTAAHLEEVTQSEVMKFSAGGFRDFTRIAASDPIMWRDVFLNNKDAVLEMLGRFHEDLNRLETAIEESDGDTLYNWFDRTRDIRRGIVAVGQETSEPDFGRLKR